VRIYSYMRLEGGFARPMWQQLMTQAMCFWRYLALFFTPASQSVVHSVTPVTTLLDPVAWSAVIALAALCALVFRARRAAPLLAFGVAWFILLLLPSSLVSLLEHMAEHRAYEASMGFFLVCAFAGGRLQQLCQARHLPSFALPAGQGLLLASLGAATVARNRVWSEPISLWQDAARKAPNVYAPHYALGDEYSKQGDCERAIIEYRAAIDLQPQERAAYSNLGICLAELGRQGEAQRVFNTALDVAPTDPLAHVNLGVFASSQGRFDEARARFNEALALDPDNIAARQDLVQLMGHTRGDPAEIERLCEDLRRLAPDTPAPPTCKRLRDRFGHDGRGGD
jgi:tetratricopeptide (TPR) repeat protein